MAKNGDKKPETKPAKTQYPQASAKPNGRLAGRKILLTGGVSGIGAATAKLFVEEGARLVILDISDKLQDFCKSIGAEGVHVDLFDPEATREAVDEAYRRLNGLNGLVCNAGVTLSKPFADTSLDDWHWAINGNATSVYVTCHSALDYLRRNDRATIVNIGSAVGISPLRGRAAYSASKAAVHAFTKVLAMELSPRIRCNVISPGAIDTPFVRKTFRDPDSIKRIEGMYALQRMGEPEEVAQAALFLSSFESSFVTGSTLSVDGGRVYY